MNQKETVLVKAENFVFDLFRKSNTDKLLFHNYRHTHNVVESCKEIISGSILDEEEKEMVLLAAHFHDVGYLESIENHEESSVKAATNFLKAESFDEKKIEVVRGCILATKMGNEPQSLLEEIICDADMAGLGSSSYMERTQLLREETSLLSGVKVTDLDWYKEEVEFLAKHQYYTKYAVLNFDQQKLKNLIRQRDELGKLESKTEGQEKKLKLKEEEFKLKLKKSATPERGIETMFRTALKNHMQLSAIADNKANMMLSISALVLSIVISSLASKFDTHSELILPTIFMLVVCLISIVLATLSTSPKITAGRFTTEDVKNRRANLLFFGNFYKMSLNDYEWGMKEVMKDKEYLYSSLIRDLYFLGVVLARKYKYLRFCYMIFMYGMIASVLFFGISIIMAGEDISDIPTQIGQ